MSNNEILVTENLTKKYGRFVALDKLNLKIKRNTCVGFLGPNGAGKSTTIKILTGVARPTSGAAYIDNFDVTQDIRHAMSGVGAIVETPEFFPYLTPQEILTYFGKLRGMSQQSLNTRINQVIELVNLEQWKKQKVGKFSKGMKQRVGIASAILHDPLMLILDEPTEGLDPRGKKEVIDILKLLIKEGKTIFVSSHMLSEVQQVCDTVALIDKGNLLRFEKIDELNIKYSNIEIQVVQAPSEQQLALIKEFVGIRNVKHENTSILVDFDGGQDERATLLIKVQEMGLRVVSFRTMGSDLEALYMDVVSESVR